MEPSPDSSRVKKALMCDGEPDRVPLVELGIDKEIKERFVGHPVDTLEDDIDFWVKAGCDFAILSAGTRTVMGPRHEQVGIRGVKEDLSAHYSANSEGTSARAQAREGKGLVATREDFCSFRWPKPDDFDWSGLKNAHKYLPRGMKAIVAIGCVFMPAWQLMGLETFCYTLYDDEELVSRVFQRIIDIQPKSFLRAIGYDCVAQCGCRTIYLTPRACSLIPSTFANTSFRSTRRPGRSATSADCPTSCIPTGCCTE